MLFSTPLFLATLASIPSTLASPLNPLMRRSTPGLAKNETLSIASGPNFYSGPWQNFPGSNTWLSFDDLFNRNRGSMLNNGDVNSDVDRIWNGIKDAATMGVDERVILAIIMQESHGNVGVQTTFSPEGIPTAGLMQCWQCPGFPGRHGDSLSQADITAMIRGGTDHFKGNLRNWGDCNDARCVYPALREYNSGNVNPNDLSDGRGATPSYVSDVVQRLGGWVN